MIITVVSIRIAAVIITAFAAVGTKNNFKVVTIVLYAALIATTPILDTPADVKIELIVPAAAAPTRAPVVAVVGLLIVLSSRL